MKRLITLAFAAIMAASLSMTAFGAGSKSGSTSHGGGGRADSKSSVTYANRAETSGHWVQNGDGSWSFAKNQNDSGVWTGWIVNNNQWYYIGANGKMLSGWQQINGVWYYLAPSRAVNQPTGSLYQAKTTPDHYRVDRSGAWVH